MTNMPGSKLSIFSHPGKITGYWIPGQYGNAHVLNYLLHTSDI
jgi:hypothetical protein